jgi:hypothetical protein
MKGGIFQAKQLKKIEASLFERQWLGPILIHQTRPFKFLDISEDITRVTKPYHLMSVELLLSAPEPGVTTLPPPPLPHPHPNLSLQASLPRN